VNKIKEALDTKQYCSAAFLDKAVTRKQLANTSTILKESVVWIRLTKR
jgi:hypothetical protein